MVTVVMSVYNGTRYLTEQLDSSGSGGDRG